MSDLMYAVFVEPDRVLAELILRWKSRADAVAPGQPYCCHPPHMTLYCAPVLDPARWLPCLKTAVGLMPSVPIHVGGVHVFFDDPQTGGGHTLVLRADAAPPLMALQQTIGEVAAPFLDRDVVDRRTGLRMEPFSASMSRYGYPFVGSHWIPHFTIASLRMTRDHPLIGEFQRLAVNLSMTAISVSVWRVQGDEHSRIAVCPLGGS